MVFEMVLQVMAVGFATICLTLVLHPQLLRADELLSLDRLYLTHFEPWNWSMQFNLVISLGRRLGTLSLVAIHLQCSTVMGRRMRERQINYQKYWPTKVAPLVERTSIKPIVVSILAHLIRHNKDIQFRPEKFLIQEKFPKYLKFVPMKNDQK